MKQTNEDLIYLLSLLARKREDLLNPFLEKECEWIGKSFKYEECQSAFNLVRDEYFTLWVDKHIVQLLEDKASESIRLKALKFLSPLIKSERLSSDAIDWYHSLNLEKLKTIGSLLKGADQSDVFINELECIYLRDKALFERQFKKYEKELI